MSPTTVSRATPFQLRLATSAGNPKENRQIDRTKGGD
jgi:hypothetical protein